MYAIVLITLSFLEQVEAEYTVHECARMDCPECKIISCMYWGVEHVDCCKIILVGVG